MKAKLYDDNRVIKVVGESLLSCYRRFAGWTGYKANRKLL